MTVLTTGPAVCAAWQQAALSQCILSLKCSNGGVSVTYSCVVGRVLLTQAIVFQDFEAVCAQLCRRQAMSLAGTKVSVH